MTIDPITLQFACKLVRCKARQIARPSDREDVEQELLLEIVVRWPCFDPRKANREAFVEQIVRNKICKMLRDRRRLKRDTRREVPFDARVHAVAQSDAAIESLCLRIDVGSVLPNMPQHLRDACDELRRESLAAAARRIGMPWSTLAHHLDQVRAAFRRAELDQYLGEPS